MKNVTIKNVKKNFYHLSASEFSESTHFSNLDHNPNVLNYFQNILNLYIVSSVHQCSAKARTTASCGFIRELQHIQLKQNVAK